MNQAVIADGTDITNQGAPIVVAGDDIVVTLAQANNDDGVTVVIDYEASQS
jgi:hypothetical protein